MNLLKGIVFCAVMTFALSASAQQAGNATNSQSDDQSAMHARVMAADEHMKALLAQLDLTAEQKSTVIRILFALQDETMRIVENPNLSREEQLAQIKPLRAMAHSHIVAIMNDAQKKTLDDFMHSPHE